MKKWQPSDISKKIKIRSNDLEFQDSKGEWQHFTIIVTPQRIVFGGCCNAGFIESGYIIRESFESIDETLQELLSDLEAYYNGVNEYLLNRIRDISKSEKMIEFESKRHAFKSHQNGRNSTSRIVCNQRM